jgi:hypothetical protein
MPSMCRPSPRLKADDSDVSASTVVNHAVGSILACGRWRAREGGSERIWWACRADRLRGTRVSRKVFQRVLKGLYVKEKGGSERLSEVGRRRTRVGEWEGESTRKKTVGRDRSAGDGGD